MASIDINLLFDDEIRRNYNGPDEYVLKFGDNVIWSKPVDYWRDTEEDQLQQGRNDFADVLSRLLTSQD